MDKSISQRLDSFFSKHKLITYKKRETILHAGDEPSGIHYIKKGYVRSYSVSEEGRELTLNIYKPGSYFDIIWALGGVDNSYFFEAMTKVEVWKAPTSEVLKFIKSDPEVLYELTGRLVVGLSGLLVRIQYLLLSDAHHKVASVLLMLAKRFGEKNKDGESVIKLRFTHQDIANLAGITRETTSFEMKKFERSGIIGYKGHQIVVKNIKKLKGESVVYFEDKSLPTTY